MSKTSPEDFLLNLLADGSMLAAQVEQAAVKAGWSMRHIGRAKRKLAIKSLRSGKGWMWVLAEPDKGLSPCKPQDGHEQKPKQEAEAVKMDIAPEQSVSAPLEPPPMQPLGPALWQVAMVRNDHAKLGTPTVQVVPIWAVMGRKAR